MRIWFPCVAALSMVVLIGAASPASAASQKSGPGLGGGQPVESQAERRLLILEAPGNVLTKAARERLHAAIAEAAAGAGLTLASAASLPDKLLGCDLPGCLPSIAAASGAVFVLRVDAKFAKESFKLALELWNSDLGKLLGKERRDCPICDEQDLWGSAAFMARGLLERTVRKATTSASVAAIVAKPGPATAPPIGPALTQARPSSAVPIVRYSGFALSVLGLAALATGIYYWSVDGDAASRPDYVRDTRKLGLPMTVAGGAALAAGAAMVGWSFWSGAAEASAGPAGVRVAGRF